MVDAICVRELTYTYHTAASPALNQLEFDVTHGEIFGFLGPSGAGKSTAQKILIGLLSGFSGTANVLGKPVSQWGRDYYQRIGVAFEFPNHFEKLTGLENLRYFGALYNGPLRSADELLERVGLTEAANDRVATYSKGMKTRLGVAKALLHQPDLIFLDEPTGGLDPVNARRIRDTVLELKQQGKTILMTTHDMHVADTLCDRVAFIVDGEINTIGVPRALKQKYGNPTLRAEIRGTDGGLTIKDFSMDNIGGNDEFIDLLREPGLETLHTQEASLDDVFVAVTGRRLQ